MINNDYYLEKLYIVLFKDLERDIEGNDFRISIGMIAESIGNEGCIGLLNEFRDNFLYKEAVLLESDFKNLEMYNEIINNNIELLRREQNIKGAIFEFDNELDKNKKSRDNKKIDKK